MVATLNYELKDAPVDLWEGSRWTVLTMLILHANIRNRCWTSIDYLASKLGKSTATIEAALKWLRKVGAVEVVPYKERVDAEKLLPTRQYVYQLTGKLTNGDQSIPYLYVSPVNGQVLETETSDGQVSKTKTSKQVGHVLVFKSSKTENLTVSSIDSSIPIDSAGSANATPADAPERAVIPETKRESAEPVKDEPLTPGKTLPRDDAGKTYLNLGNNRYQGPYAPYSTKRPAGTYLNAEMLPPDAVIVPPPGAVLAEKAKQPKQPRKVQPYDVLFDAIGEHIFGAKDAAGRAAVSGRIAPILHGDKRGGRCIGIIGYECLRQNREANELDYNQLASDVIYFMSWFKANNRDITIADCAKVLDYWQKWRSVTKGQNDKWTYDPMTGWKEPTNAK